MPMPARSERIARGLALRLAPRPIGPLQMIFLPEYYPIGGALLARGLGQAPIAIRSPAMGRGCWSS